MRIIVRAIILFIILLNINYSNPIENSSHRLLQLLMENTGWIDAQEENGFTISRKLIENKNLFALKVQKKVLFDPSIIKEILTDVKNYDKFLSSSNSIKSFELKQTNNWVDAYQHIENNIPFLDNREYCFRISTNSIDGSDSSSIVHWYLLEKNFYNTTHLVGDDKSIYLNYGAGLWLAEQQVDQSVLISYVVYIDPGGSIPNFLIEKANKVSLVNILKDTITESKRRLALKTG